MKILIACATTDNRLNELIDELQTRWSNAELHILRPAGRPLLDFPGTIFLKGSADQLLVEDITSTGRFDVAVLAIAHVGRALYPTLVQGCCTCANACFLYSTMGLQPLDARDADESLFSVVGNKLVPPKTKIDSWVFFRPSDRTAHALADEYVSTGVPVIKVETLAALEENLTPTTGVFFDWCITHYPTLFQAVQMAATVGCRMEALLSLDLSDLAENHEQARRLLSLNHSALKQMDHVYYLGSRSFLVERYDLIANTTPRWNHVGGCWARSASQQSPRPNDSLSFVYHGLFYPWHEVGAFIPVYKELSKRVETTFELFGRQHESLTIDGMELFPRKYKEVEEQLEELASLPGVIFHPFTPPKEITRTMHNSNYYVGITAGDSLMSQSETRTGVEEAYAAGMRILHKSTRAVKQRGWNAPEDYFSMDVNEFNDSVNRLLMSMSR